MKFILYYCLECLILVVNFGDLWVLKDVEDGFWNKKIVGDYLEIIGKCY